MRPALSVVTVLDPSTPPAHVDEHLRSVAGQRLRRRHGRLEHVVVRRAGRPTAGPALGHPDRAGLLDRAHDGGPPASGRAAVALVEVEVDAGASDPAALGAALAASHGELVLVLADDDVLDRGAAAALLDVAAGRPVAGARSVGPPADPVDVVYADHDVLLDEAPPAPTVVSEPAGGTASRRPAPDGGPDDVDRADGPWSSVVDGGGRRRRVGPADRKPAWSPERLRSLDYVGAPVVLRRALVDEVGGWRGSADGAHHHDLLLRAGERARRVVHVPRVLLHRRRRPPAPASATETITDAVTARVVAEHRRRVGLDPDAPGAPIAFDPSVGSGASAPPDEPLVSVVVPTNGATGEVWGVERCFVVEAVRSLVDRSSHRRLELVVVVDAGTPAGVIHALRDVAGDRLTLVGFDRPFNFSEKIAAGVAAAGGDLLLLLNDDTELVEPAGVGRLAAAVLGPAEGVDGRWGDIAMAGARLLFDDGTLQHGGVACSGFADHVCRGWPGDSPGPAPSHPLAGARECSVVTAAAAMVRRDAWDEVGGMSPELPLNFNDVDLCLRLRRAGHRIVYRPDAVWYHFESRTRVPRVLDRETAWMDERWSEELRADPYHHPALIPGRFDWREADRDVEPAARAPGVLRAAVARNVAAAARRITDAARITDGV